MTFAIGVLFVVFSLVLYLVPSIVDLAREGWAFRSFLNGVGGAITVAFGIHVVLTAKKSGVKRILRADFATQSAE